MPRPSRRGDPAPGGPARPRGRALAPLKGIGQIVGLFSPGADMMDMAGESGATVEAVRAGDYAGAGAAGLGTVAAALGMLVPGTARGYRTAAEELTNAERAVASKSARAYDLPTKSEVGNVAGNGAPGGVDLEGRPLVARFVAGRNVGSEVEQSLGPEAVSEIFREGTPYGLEFVPRRDIRDRADGAYRYLASAGLGGRVADDLDEVSRHKVAKHELGHFVDHSSGWQKLPASKDLRLNLRELYHGGLHGFGDRRGYDARGVYTNPKYMTGPLDVGYPKSEETGEFWAEALRQYMTAPDTMKARFPEVAARARPRGRALASAPGSD